MKKLYLDETAFRVTNIWGYFIEITVIGTPRPKYYSSLPSQYRVVLPPPSVIDFNNPIVCSLNEKKN